MVDGISTKVVLLTFAGSAAGTVLPYATLRAVFADTTWPDVGLELVKTIGIIAGLFFAMIAANRAGGAKTEATEAKTAAVAAKAEVGTISTKVDAAAGEAQLAKVAAKNAVVVAVESEKRAAAGREVLKQMASHTNGEFAALKAERDELRRWKEAQLAASTPPDVVAQIGHLTEVVDEASKSGVFKRPKPPAEPT